MYSRFCMFRLLLVMLCVFAGCSTKDKGLTRLSLVLDRPANPNHIPLYVGGALGYFRDEGIFLDIQKPQVASPLALIDEGKADLVLASLPRVFRAIARESNIIITGKLIEKPLKGFLTLSSSRIKTLDDFHGRILGYDGNYSIFPSAEIILDLNNVQVGCKLNLHDKAIDELVSKKIDIVYGALANLEPEYLVAHGYKVRFLLGTDYGMPEYEEVVVAASGNFIHVDAFQKALQKSIDFCCEKPELAFEMYQNLMTNKSPKTLAWEEVSWKKTVPILAKQQKFSEEAAKKLATWQYENDLIGRPIAVEDYLY